MKINDLSKELGISNKDIITFLRDKNFEVTSHLQNATDEMCELARERFVPVAKEEVVEKPVTKKPIEAPAQARKYEPTDLIPCKSVVPWGVVETSQDVNSGVVYRWGGYGDVEYITYRDLQWMRRRDVIKNGMIIIDDPDLCQQWARDLGESYKMYIGVEYPEEFFYLTDEKFEKNLRNAPDTYKEVIKFTCMNMIRNENYPSVQKINIIDEVLGTCIKEFL